MIEYKVEVYDNETVWRLDGKLHREGDLPAVERSEGHKEWWLNGKLHRENNKPAKILSNGSKLWFVNGRLHRTNGAAIEWDRWGREWFIDGFTFCEHTYLTGLKHFNKNLKTKQESCNNNCS